MTAFSDEDTDKLVEMIRQHPALFNSQLDSYRDENLKDNIWKSIAEGLNKSDSECRKKWKLTKDSYNRYKRKQKCSTGSAAPAKNSKWGFFERLRFLENTPSQRQSSTNIEATSTSEVVDVDSEADEEPSLLDDTVSKEVGPTPGTSTALDTSTQEISTAVNKNSDKKTKRISKRKATDDVVLKLLKEIHESRQLHLQAIAASQHSFQQPIDEISSFGKNIEMSLRKLSVRSISMAKNEIYNIISKYEMLDIDRENAHPYYSSPSSNTTIYSPITASPIPEYQSQNSFIDLSSTPQQFQDISTEQFQSNLNDQFQNNNDLPSTSQRFM